MTGPLQGIRIIDLTSTLMGPFATQILGDLGAEIIKVEPPQGDVLRDIGAKKNPGMGALFLNNNRSKKSVQIDLKAEDGRQLLLRLCQEADVLIYNMREQAMQRLNLGYEVLKEVNPKLIYVGVHGFGEKGQYANRPAYDDLIQAGSGLAHLFSYQNKDGTPAYVPNAIADRVGGLTAGIGILSALWERASSNKGQKVHIPMFETMVNFVMSDHLDGLSFVPPLGKGGYGRQLSPHRKPYKTKDGYIGVLFYTDAHWQRFFTAIGETEKTQKDPRYKDMASRQQFVDEIYSDLNHIFAQHSTEHWMSLLVEADVPAMQLHDFDSLLTDPHLEDIDFFKNQEHPTEGTVRTMQVPLNFSRTPAQPNLLAPNLGEHTNQVLSSLGISTDELNALSKSGIINNLQTKEDI